MKREGLPWLEKEESAGRGGSFPGPTQSDTWFMVLTSDGNSEHVAHAWRKIGPFGGKKFDLLLLSI